MGALLLGTAMTGGVAIYQPGQILAARCQRAAQTRGRPVPSPR